MFDLLLLCAVFGASVFVGAGLYVGAYIAEWSVKKLEEKLHD